MAGNAVFSPEKTHQSVRFFKIVLRSSVRDQKLMMPKKFARMYGHELAATASLTVPNGSVWEVGLDKTNDQIWFCYGWNKFAEYYSISFGHLLVFKYERNSSFQVLIFDTTASEIQYPQHDKMMQISDSSYFDRKVNDGGLDRRYVLKKSSENLCGTLRRNTSKRTYKTDEYSTRSKKCKVEDYIKIEDSDVVSDPRQIPLSSARNASNRGKMANIRAAERFKTKNPSFMVILGRTNIQKNYVHVPSAFGTKYLSRREQIKLQKASNGQQWRINCYFCGTSSTRRMGSGWTAFSRENKLKIGDVIVFELAKRSKKDLLNFTVFSGK